MKYLILLCVALLAGCRDESSPAFVKYEVEAEGCLIKYVDNPKGYNFFIAKCPAESVTVTNQRPSGKSSTTDVTVTTKENLRRQLEIVEAKEKALAKLTDEEKNILGVK